MEIILLQDIPKLGKKDEIKDVAEGYARNFLIPQKLAVLATAEAVRRIDGKKETGENRAKKDLKNKKQIAKAINNTRFEIKMRVETRGKLYGSVTPAIISEKLKVEGFEINPSNIILKNPIKEAGEYSVKIDFGDNITANIKILIVAE